MTLPVDLDLLAEVIKENDVALVSLDPLMTLVGAQLDTHKDHEVRRALEPLALVADDTDVAILGNGHFNKSLSGGPMSRITGSAAFGQVVRGVLAFAKDEEADLCVISQAKSNLGRLDLPNLAYCIENAEIATPEGSASVGRMVWCGQSERSVADLLRPVRQEASNEQDEAAAWLQEPEVLGGGQERLVKELNAAAKDEGIAVRTLQRAASKVCERRKGGFGGPVWWRLKAPHTRPYSPPPQTGEYGLRHDGGGRDMSPAAALLTRVRAAGAELVVHGDGLRWRAPEPLPTELLVALKVHKSELLAYLRESAGLAVYRRRIEEARSWDDLYAVLADAEVAYSANELTGDKVEDLAAACAQEAHRLPDHTPEVGR